MYFSITVKRIFLIPFLLWSTAAVVRAQSGDLRGVVTDSTTGERVPFVSIIIGGTQKGGSTNINGFYLITNIPSGMYQVTASSVGYVKVGKRVLIRSGESNTTNFLLTPEALQFQEVVITERTKKELTEINTSIHVLEQRDIRAVPVAVQEDVFRAIQILPGVISTSDVNSHFYVRGGGGDQNLILLDGMKIYNPYHAFGIFSTFDADIIKTTEVYTGAFPPGFGGRLSSVVNMTTRDGTSTRLAGKANINFVSTKLQLEGPLFGSSEVHWMFSGRKSLFSDAFSKFLRRDVPVSFYDVFGKIVIEKEESHDRFGFEGFSSGDDMLGAGLQDPDYHWRNHALGFVTGGLIQDRLYVDASGFGNLFEARKEYKPGSSGLPTSTMIQETGLRANATYYTDTKDLYFFGFEFSFPKLEYDLVNRFDVRRKLKSNVVESSSWFRYQTTQGFWQIDGGFHIDIGSIFQRGTGLQSIQPRINASYSLGERWRAKASYGQFSQNIITVNNEDDIISVFDAWIAVPEKLPPERADHYVLGIEGSVLPELSTNVQAYYKEYRSLVIYNREKVDQQDPDYVGAGGSSYGIEFLFRYGIPAVDCYGTYTYGVATIDNVGFTYAPRYDRRHSVNLLTVVHASENIDVSLRWEIGSGFPFSESAGYYDRLSVSDPIGTSYVNEPGSPYIQLGPKNAARLPAYHRLDASASYRFTLGRVKGTAGLHIVNIYDRKNLFYFERSTGNNVYMLTFFPTLTMNLEY
jgi:hypothetical protein